jgi:hypothetical protein
VVGVRSADRTLALKVLRPCRTLNLVSAGNERLAKGQEMDWKSELFRAAGFVGITHFAAEVLPRKSASSSTSERSKIESVLYSLDSNPAAVASVAEAASLLWRTRWPGEPGTSTPSKLALERRSGGFGAALFAAGVGYLVGKSAAKVLTVG